MRPSVSGREGNRPTAVVCVSGGMDSCVTVAEAAAAGYSLALLHARYGQRTEARELRAFRDIADHFGVPEGRRLVCDLAHLGRIGGSSLTDRALPIEEGPPAAGRIPTSYVPFRNAHFLAIAVSWGEVLGAEAIYIGAVAADSSGYPDCREEYYEAFNRLIAAGTRPETRLRVVAPLIRMRKSAIVRRGIELGAPLGATWSCYQSEERPCLRCESCLLRQAAFRDAGIADPI